MAPLTLHHRGQNYIYHPFHNVHYFQNGDISQFYILNGWSVTVDVDVLNHQYEWIVGFIVADHLAIDFGLKDLTH